MASDPTFHIHLISGNEFELRPTGTLVKDLKDQITKVRGIPLYEQTLVVDGEELQNFDRVEPKSSVLLVIGASQLKNFTRDWMQNQGRAAWRPLWSRLPSSELGTKAMVQSCLQGMRAQGQSKFEFENLDVDDLERRLELPVWDIKYRAARWPLSHIVEKPPGRDVRPYLTEEDVEDYLQRCMTYEMALQSEAERNAIFKDPYDQDMLGLMDGDVAMQAMLDYRQKCWDNISTLTVEDAQRISQHRDSLVQDQLDQQVLSTWESGVCPMSPWHLAGSGEASRTDTSEPPWPLVAIHGGTALLCGARPGGEWQELKLTDIPNRPPSPWWKASSLTLQQMDRGELPWTRGNWQQVMKDLKLDLDLRTCSFLMIESVMDATGALHALRRRAISESLCETGVATVGFASCLTLVATAEDMQLRRQVAGRSARQPPIGKVFIEATKSSAILAPVFEGYLLTDAITQVNLTQDLPQDQALATATLRQCLARCSIDHRFSIGRHIIVYGEGYKDQHWRSLEGRDLKVCDTKVLYDGLSQALFNTRYRQSIFQYEKGDAQD